MVHKNINFPGTTPRVVGIVVKSKGGLEPIVWDRQNFGRVFCEHSHKHFKQGQREVDRLRKQGLQRVTLGRIGIVESGPKPNKRDPQLVLLELIAYSKPRFGALIDS